MDNLWDKRVEASVLTGGLSTEIIHSKVQGLALAGRSGGELLDFGAGRGVLTSNILSTGQCRSVTAADIFERPAELDSRVRWIRTDLNFPLDVPASSFDTVISAEVIEHLENPRSVVREFFRLLRPKGELVLSTPNNESWRALINLAIRGHYTTFLLNYPDHITALLRLDIERILTEAGFADVSFCYCDHGYVPCFPDTLQWRDISFGCLKGKRYSDTIFVTARKP